MDRVVRSVALRSVSWTLLSCLMLLAQVQAVQQAQDSPRSRCPSGSMYYSSYCYSFFPRGKTWMDAYFDCSRRPAGHLVSVLTGSEGSFISALIKSTVNSFNHVWIGLHDPTEGTRPNGGGWQWSNGDILSYSSWERFPPISSTSSYCGSVSRTSDFKKWRDVNCEAILPYVCKFKN
ncbi:lithostathine-like [Talpa occidentalis]|uniref:lithostathine-like n=1 Tax=Talpa occidentalis TaxID=50954 RepID=UPI00188E8971|nr:lithostathine-like [Talpa occidentalis]